MTTNTIPTLLLQDGEGTYYLLTAELLAQAQVPAEKAAELETLVRSSLLEAGDTAGFAVQLPGQQLQQITILSSGDLRLLGALPALTPAALPPQLSPES